MSCESETVGTAVKEDKRGFLKSCEILHRDTIGHDRVVATPFGSRRIVYADFTASGRALRSVEGFIREQVLPEYGNVHSTSTSTARQTSNFREEARSIIRNYLNCNEHDALIFTGNGATGACDRFIRILESSNWLPLFGQDQRNITETRWGSYSCKSCSLQIKDESGVKAHLQCEQHKKAVAADGDGQSPRLRLINFILDPALHHSSLLSFKELRDMHRNDVSCFFRTETVQFDPATGLMDISHLAQLLKTSVDFKNNFENNNDNAHCQTYVIASGCSNITGIKLPVVRMNILIHQYHAFAIWDMASLLGHSHIDLNPVANSAAGYCDACFFSPHKLLGGPDTSGLLAVKKLFMVNSVPSFPGGGVVRFVAKDHQLYIVNSQEREEAGTPNVVACIRAGLCLKVASLLPSSLVWAREAEFLNFVLNSWKKCSTIHNLGPLIVVQGFQASETAEAMNTIEASNILTQRKAVLSFMIKYGNRLEQDSDLGIDSVPNHVVDGVKIIAYPNRRTKGGLYLHQNFVSAVLNDVFGIQARPGCACAGPLAHELLGFDERLTKDFSQCLEETGAEVLRPGFVRISLHYSMTWDDVELIAEAVKWVATFGWRLLPFYTFDAFSGEWTQNLVKPSKFRKWLSDFNLDHELPPHGVKSYLPTGVDNPRYKIDPRKIVGAVALPGMGGAMLELKETLLNRRSNLKKAGTTKMPPVSHDAGMSSVEPEPVKPSEVLKKRKQQTVPIEPFAPLPPACPQIISSTSPKIVPSTSPKLTPASPPVAASPFEEEDSIFEPSLLFRVTRGQDQVPQELADFYTSANRLIDAIGDRVGGGELEGSFERRIANLNKRGLSPPLPASYSHLVWFALPGDAAFSLRLFQRKGTDKFPTEEYVPLISTDPSSPGWPSWWSNGDEDVRHVQRIEDSPFEVRHYPIPSRIPQWPSDTLLFEVKSNIEGTDHPASSLLSASSLLPASSLPRGNTYPSLVSAQPAAKLSPRLASEERKCSKCSPSINHDEQQQATSSSSSFEDDDENPVVSSPNLKSLTMIPKQVKKLVGRAMDKFKMIKDGDSILVGLSGGKDSLTMLHVLLDLQKRSPVSFSVAAATVDPQTPEYNPHPLVPYLQSLGVPYHMLSYPIIELAKTKMQKDSLCSFCARMKRGMLYSCMKTHGYSTLALGQHLDDIAESFLMSAFYNGSLNTMKVGDLLDIFLCPTQAHYTTNTDLRVIRPLSFVREKDLAAYARLARLPVITDNCPACFAAPTERIRMKHLLAQQEFEFPNTMGSLSKALTPLMNIGSTEDDDECAGSMCPR